MYSATRPSLTTAAAVLTTGSLLAVTPVAAPCLLGAHMSSIQLTAGVDFEPVWGGQDDFGVKLGGGEMNLNDSLPSSQLPFESVFASLFKDLSGNNSDDSILNGVLGHLSNVANVFPDGNEPSLDGLLGVTANVADAQTITTSLPTSLPTGGPTVGSGNADIGGIESVSSQNVLLLSDITTALGISAADLDALLTSLQAAEIAFNANLVTQELALEQAAFGSNNALNGVVNQLFSAFNTSLDAQEQGLNGLLGAGTTAFDPAEVTNSLALNLGSSNFFTDLSGITPAELDTLLNNFDSTAFMAALTNLFDFSAFNSLSDPLNTVFGDIFTTLFGGGAG